MIPLNYYEHLKRVDGGGSSATASVFKTLADRPNSLAGSSTDLYFSGLFTTDIYKVEKSSGNVSTFISPGVNTYKLATDDTNLFYSKNGVGEIFEAPLASGTASTFVSPQDGVLCVSTDRLFLYHYDNNTGVLGQIEIADNTNFTTIATVPYASAHPTIATDDTYVYLNDFTAGLIKVEIATGIVTVLSSFYGAVSYDSGTLYGVNASTKEFVSINTLTGATTSIADLSSLVIGTPTGLVIDGSDAYVADYQGTQIIKVENI